jgi:hypothetical protein
MHQGRRWYTLVVRSEADAKDSDYKLEMAVGICWITSSASEMGYLHRKTLPIPAQVSCLSFIESQRLLVGSGAAEADHDFPRPLVP